VPDEIAGRFGPQLTALIAYLTVVCRLPGAVVQRLLAGALQDPDQSRKHAEGGRRRHRGGGAVRTTASGIGLLNAHETGPRTNAAKSWPWTLVAPTFVLHHRDDN
jgi:hypothetical protein